MPLHVERSLRSGSVPRWDRPVRLTPLYREHLGRGATMAERDGWLLPQSYGTPKQERSTVRTGASLIDIGDGGKLDLKGAEVEAVLRAAFPSLVSVDVGARATGPEAGTLVYRLRPDEAIVLIASSETPRIRDALQAAASKWECIHLTDLTGALCGLRLLGPQAPAVLERLSALDLTPDRFADGACVQGALARIHALIARRDTLGLPGYDLYVDRDLGVYLWDALLEAGDPLGFRPAGRAVEEPD